jgi:diketogulonate reductase-like aldo/keto reductase
VHPYNARAALIELCTQKGIAVEAYCPLGGRGNKGQVTDRLDWMF